jgi:hypothetical protein
MPDVAKNITNLRPPEQEMGQSPAIEPWLRQKGEPAKLYLWFKRYLDLGPKRSLRKALAAEPSAQKATKGTAKGTQEAKKLSDVSVPGAWKRASKLWRWVERAEAYDLAQMEKRATQIREMVSSAPYASRAYRILRLDYVARILIDQIKSGIEVDKCLAITARYMAILQMIAKEMGDVDEATMNACDASAMLTIKQEMADNKKKQVETRTDNSDIDQLIAMLEKSGRLD